MINLYKKIEKWWFENIPDQIRFLLVGGFNTTTSYFIFIVLCLFCDYTISLVITYALGINLSIFTMRYYVFAGSGKLLQQYTKALITYICMLIGNYIFLYFAIDIYNQAPWLAQAEYTFFSTIALYITHKNVNFI